VSFAINPMSLRIARLIQISTTATGCKMHNRSSIIFFIPGFITPTRSL